MNTSENKLKARDLLENWATQPVLFKIPKVLSMKIIVFCNMIMPSHV